MKNKDSNGGEVVFRFFRYGFVGLVGTLIHVGTVVVLVELLKLNPLFSSCIAFTLALIVSYILNRKWTFEMQHHNMIIFAKYLIVSLIGLGLNMLIMYITVYVLKWWYFVGLTLVVIIVPISNFFLNLLYTFNEKRVDSE